MVGKDSDFASKDDEFGDNIGLGCALEMFSEVNEVLDLIDNLKNIYNSSGSEMEAQYDKLYIILKQYYEQPHLLDPHLDKFLNRFVDILRDDSNPKELKHATLKYMYQIIRVRGYKVVIRHLPHEISDLIPVLTFLESQNPDDTEKWRSRFVLLLWLSIISMMPFHMSRLDAFRGGEKDSEGVEKKTVMGRIFNLCKTYSLVTDSCAEAGAFLASKFLTRSDVKEKYLSEFFDWSCQENKDLTEDNVKYGVLATVSAILKHGKREDLLPYADMLLKWVITQDYRSSKAILTRKYAVKIIQRIGLIYLKSKVATWRYTRGSRTLKVNLQAAGDKSNDVSMDAEKGIEDEEDDELDIPEQLEDVIEQLLIGLRDNDNVVRWCAAKGIGRVSGRLGKLGAGEVSTSIMELFSHREVDAAWHGGCLALAELGRRGLLLPSQLPSAVDVVLKALQYEELRGCTPTGQHVRDAACYVCWAFARAYDANVLRPYVKRIAVGLIITALFDREIHCRRAASAAFQEHVGRQGAFPNGIEILTAADFFSVGLRNNSFLNVGPWVAQFSDYTLPLVDHLVSRKVNHWDIAIRDLTAKTLHKITEKCPQYMAASILPKLLEKTSSIDLNARHGSILALGEVVNGLHLVKLEDGRNGDVLIEKQVWCSLMDIVPMLNSKYMFRGMGGELMRQACCSYIEKLSLAQAPYHGNKIIEEWLNLIEECLTHEVLIIREKAIAALPAVFLEYLSGDTNTLKNGTPMEVDNQADVIEKRKRLVEKYCAQLEDVSGNGMCIRMGHALAIGVLPSFALEDNLPLIIKSLVKSCRITEVTMKWAEARRDSIKALTNVCQTVGIKTLQQKCEGSVQTVLDCLILSLEEYTVDMRGDIGAWVREVSMAGLLSICKQCAVEEPLAISPDTVHRVMLGLAQQCVEKIDRTRAYAGKIFTQFLHFTPKIPHIPHHSELLAIFPQSPEDMCPSATNVPSHDDSTNIKLSVSEGGTASSAVLWLFASHTMPHFIRLLDYEVFRYNIILGLTVGAGDMTENLVKHTTSALYAYLTSLHDDLTKLSSICDHIIKVFSDNHGNNRIIIPMLSFLDRLLSSGCLSPILEDPDNRFASEILKHVKHEMKSNTNMYKHLDSITVLCQLIQVNGAVCRASLTKLLICICSGQKYIRKSTATRLYDALLIYGDSTGVSDENLDQIMQYLADTNWESEVSVLKPIRNTICDLMGLPHPIAVPIKARSD